VSIARLSVERPVAVAMLMLAVVFLGVIAFLRLPIDLLPSIAYPRLVVYTRYPDVGPTEVERFVSEPIERVVGRVPGVERVESVSREGISLVTLRFAWGTDMDFAVLNVREQLDNVRDQIPELASRPVVLRTDPDADPIIAISISGGTDLAALKDLSESVFKRRLEQIDGIAEAAIAGGLEREIHVEVNPRLLETFGFTVDQVVRALDAANQSAPGGTIRRGRYRYALRTLGEFQSVEEIGGVPLGQSETGTGRGVVFLRDVAAIEDGFKEQESIARHNGADAVGLLLFKESGANTVRATQEVDQVLDQLRRLYPDVRLDVAMAQAGFIEEAIHDVVSELIQGGLLAFLVLFLFLRNVRYPLAISLAIPISVIGTFVLLDLVGVTLNIMSLGGLALGVGMLVDNSIVVLENISRLHEKGIPLQEAAVRGADEVQGAITGSTLTTIAVFAPILYVEGVAGELFAPLSLAVAFALLASIGVALTVLPTLAARMGGQPAARPRLVVRMLKAGFAPIGRAGGRLTRPFLDRFDAWFARVTAWYLGVLARALERRGRIVALAGGTLLLGVALALVLDRDVLPDVDQGAFTVRLELPRGTPLERTGEATAQIESVLRGDPGVATVFSRVGRQAAVGGVEDEESGLNTSQLEVLLAPGHATADVIGRLRPQFPPLPEGSLAIQTGTATALGRLMGSDEADLVVRVRGDDLDAIRRYAMDVEARLLTVAAVTNVRLGSEEGQPEIRIEVDRARAASYGIEPRLIAQTIEQSMRGAVATEYVDFDEKVPVVVRLPDADRRSLETLRTMQVGGVPLRELVTTHEETGPAEVRRVDQGRIVEVFSDVATGGLDGALAEVRRAVAELPPPRGVRTEIGGANEERARSFRGLAFAFGVAVLLVYMILAAEFESLLHPFTVLLSVPLAVVGASLALFLGGAGINTMSLIGMVILVGVVDNDAIIIVDFINRARAQGRSVRAAIMEAGHARLRPVLMTTGTTILGLLPMALGFGRGADLRQPLALAVIGGLVSSTALTLVVVPVAYTLWEDARARLGALVGRETPDPAPEATS
jgi:HAE1 family hydrophobic/amphiphilic exporter-1